MTCFRDAEEQFVYDDIRTSIHAISQPHCTPCSEEQQPPETVGLFPLESLLRPPCMCEGCDECFEEAP